MLKVEKPRLQFLESIRGLAALVVVFYHLTLGFWPEMDEPTAAALRHERVFFQALARSPFDFCYYGLFAVNVFFVLSGFVLTYSYFRSPRAQTLTAAALRRYFRLAIPALVSVLASYGLMRWGVYRNAQAAAIDGSGWLGTWCQFTPSLWSNDANGAFRQGLYGTFLHEEATYNNVLWTMYVELYGSLLVFGFLALFGTVRNRWILYGVAATLLVDVFNDSFLLSFLGGMVLCDLYVRFEVRQRTFNWGLLGWPILLLGCGLGGYKNLPALPPNWAWLSSEGYARTTGAMLVVAAPLFSMALRRVMDARPLAWLGRISFGLYLTHVLVLLSIGCNVYVRLRHRHVGHDSAALVAGAVTIGVSLLTGWAMYYVADVPSIALGKWLVGRVFLPASPQRLSGGDPVDSPYTAVAGGAALVVPLP